MIEQPFYSIDHLKKYRVINKQEEVLIRWEGYQDQTWEPIKCILNPDQETMQAIKAMRDKYKELTRRLARKDITVQHIQVYNPFLRNAQALQKKLQKRYFRQSLDDSGQSLGRKRKNKIKKGKVTKFTLKEESIMEQGEQIISKQKDPSFQQIKDEPLHFRIKLPLNQKQELQQSQISAYSEYFERKKEQLEGLSCLAGLSNQVSRIEGTFQQRDDVYYQVFIGRPQEKYPILLHQSHLVKLCPQALAEYLLAKIN